jgi:hypothetical protein
MRASSPSQRARGQSLGEAFASLTSNGRDPNRSQDMANAIGSGFRNAARRDEYERNCAESPEMLRNMGFHGVDRDFD